MLISEDLDEPRSIVLDLNHGFMFWSDWGKNPELRELGWMAETEKLSLTLFLNGTSIAFEYLQHY